MQWWEDYDDDHSETLKYRASQYSDLCMYCCCWSNDALWAPWCAQFWQTHLANSQEREREKERLRIEINTQSWAIDMELKPTNK